MKKKYIAILTVAAGLCSCIEMMDSASQADVVNPLDVSFKVKAVTGFVDADGNGTINTDFPVEGLTVRFTNFEEDAIIETQTDENGIAQAQVAPGNYTISVFGESESEGNTYYLNGSVQNKTIMKDITPEQAEASNDFSIAIRPAMVGPLCFSQIFYCGSTNPTTQSTYFRDQFYEIYNNGDETYYLDHLCFARLVPEYDGDNAPVIRGSALGGLNGEPAWEDKIMELMNAVDEYIPIPQRENEKPFLMPVEDVFSITGRGTVVTGRIETGIIHVGDPVEIVGLEEKTLTSTCTGVEMFRKLLDEGEAGDNVGLLLRGIDKKEVKRGMVVAKPGSITPHTEFEAEVYILKKEEGGRHTPFHNNYRPQFYLRTMDVTGEVHLPAGVDMVMPGDHVTITVKLIYPVAINEGLRFAIREGGRTVGAGQILKIVK